MESPALQSVQRGTSTYKSLSMMDEDSDGSSSVHGSDGSNDDASLEEDVEADCKDHTSIANQSPSQHKRKFSDIDTLRDVSCRQNGFTASNGEMKDHRVTDRVDRDLVNRIQTHEDSTEGARQLSDYSLSILPTPDTPDESYGERTWQNGSHPHSRLLDTGISTNGERPRKRKPSFRTRTGCMTCRRRKKKCGEEKPTCLNCSRSQRKCDGYQNHSPSVRLSILGENKTTPKIVAPLQSKSRPEEADVDLDFPTSQASNGLPILQAADRYGHVENTAAVRDTNYANSTVSRDAFDRPAGYVGRQGQPSWPPQQGQAPTQDTYTKDLLPLKGSRTNGDLRGTSAAQDMGPPTSSAAPSADMTQHHARSQPPSASSHHYARLPQPPPPPQGFYSSTDYHSRHPSYPSPSSYDDHQQHRGQTSASHPPEPLSHNQSQHPYTSQPPPSSGHSSLSLSTSTPSTTTSTGTKLFTAASVAKSKMLRSAPYHHLDPTLVSERRRAAAACDAYNADMSPHSSKTDEEVRASLWKVLDPSRDRPFAALAPLTEKGYLGYGVVVEREFGCSYGYNLRLMDSCYVGEDVYIDDAAKVEVGPRSCLGRGVRVYTSSWEKGMLARKGVGSECAAREVVVESEVIVGPEVVIMGGVRLGRGCEVKSGCRVERDVRAGEVFDERGDGGGGGGGGGLGGIAWAGKRE